jgi:NAD(P)-dependent dehydrogenase (short-subunit alcohol dehydrogenase family)
MRILITGANRGLGLALAQIGAERGHHILAGIRNVHHGASNLNYSQSITILPLDVTDEESVAHSASIVKDLLRKSQCQKPVGNL